MVFDVFMKVDFVSVHNNEKQNKKVAQHLFILAPRLITYMRICQLRNFQLPCTIFVNFQRELIYFYLSVTS